MHPQWQLNRTLYRLHSGSERKLSLSCGFLNKSGWTTDVTRETYNRLAMIYILRGQGHYEDSVGIQSPLRSGDVFFRYPDRYHTTTIQPDSQWQECFLSVRAEWFHLFSEMRLIDPARTVIPLGEAEALPRQILHCLENMSANDTPLANTRSEFEMVTLIQQVLLRAQERAQARIPRKTLVDKAREIIRNRAQENCDIESLLAPIGISYSRLRTLFRQAYGTSPGDYRIQVRIERASNLLRTSTLSIKEIADQLGYADAFSFSKQFKQRTRVAPLTFRRQSSD